MYFFLKPWDRIFKILVCELFRRDYWSDSVFTGELKQHKTSDLIYHQALTLFLLSVFSSC